MAQRPYGQKARSYLQHACPWDFRRGRRSAAIPDGTTPGGRRYRCNEIGSYARAQELLRQGHTTLGINDDGEACEALR